MADETLKIDPNTRFTLGAVTNDANQFIKNVRVNPITGALIVEAHVTSTNTQIGSTIPGGTEGSVLFLDIGGTLAEDNANFFYDSTGHFLGLGTNTPDSTLEIDGTFHYVDGNQSDGYVLISDANGNATWQDPGASTTFITNLTTSTTFVNDLISNTTFTTNLAGDTNFTTVLAGDTNFVTNLANNTTFTTELFGLVGVATDATLTGDGTTGNPLHVVSGGSGTVTSVSVVTANGFSGTVATSTTTPAITLHTSITGILQGNGSAISAATTTGSGSVVLATSPTLVTPILGTPTSVTLTNGTGLPIIAGTTGTLSVARGGTGDTTLAAHGVLIGNGTGTISVTSAGTAGQVLTSNGASLDPTYQTVTAGTKLFLQTTPFVSSGTGEQTVASFAIPGGTLNTNNSVRFFIPSMTKNGSDGTTTFQIRIKYNGTTVFDTSTDIFSTNGSGSSASIDALFSAAGTTSTQIADGWVINNTGGVSQTHQNCISGSSSEDSTTNQTCLITVTPASGASVITINTISVSIIS